jgi:hypothetical protein
MLRLSKRAGRTARLGGCGVALLFELSTPLLQVYDLGDMIVSLAQTERLRNYTIVW